MRQGNRNPFIDYPQLADAIYLPLEVMTWGKWQLEFFQIRNLDQPSISGPLSDPDMDGFSNLLEFATGSSPVIPSKHPFYTVVSVGTELILKSRKTNNLELSGFSICWEISNDLISWSTLTEEPETVVQEGATMMEQVRIPRPNSQTFFRLKVTSSETL